MTLVQDFENVDAFGLLEGARRPIGGWKAQREVSRFQLGIVSNHHAALDRVFELADISRPGAVHQQVQGGVRHTKDRFVHRRGKLVDKVIGKQRNVFFAFTQGRKVNLENI